MASKEHRPTHIIIISSYVIMMLVFAVLMGGLFLYSAESITSQQRQMDKVIAERTVQQAADTLEGLFEQGEMLVQDSRLILFSALSPELQKKTGAEVGNIMGRANGFTGLTTDLLFCPSGPDMAINGSGLHEGEDLEKLLMDSLGISLEEWRQRSSFSGTRSFQVIPSTDEQGKQRYQFLMMVRKPGDENPEHACFVAGIVPSAMLNNLSAVMRPEGYEDIIAEYPEGIFSIHRQTAVTRKELEDAREGGIGIFSLLFSGKPVHVTTYGETTGSMDWKIHFFCSMGPYRNIVLVCLRNFILSVVIILLLGSIMLYFTLTRQYKPLKILMDRVSGQRTDGSPELQREYRILDQAIGALQEKQQGTESRLAEYRTRLQKTAVHQLLRGTESHEESLTDFFKEQELNLKFEQCRVLLLALDADKIIDDSEEAREDAQVQSLLEDLENHLYQCLPGSICFISDDCIECLTASDGETRDAEMLRFVKDSLMDYCMEKGIHFYAAISQPDTGTAGARRGFLQAETILDHATMAGYRDVILDELPEQQSARMKTGQETRQQQLLEYVNAHYTDASLSVLQMADVFDMSPSSISRTFRQAADTGLNTYIHTLRIARAKELIENTSDSLKHISGEVGYGNHITMIRAFKKLEGITPQEYRDQLHN